MDKKQARKAGWFYLLMGLTGGFGIMYAPTVILIPGDAAGTSLNLVENRITFLLSIVSFVIGQVLFVFLVLALDKLLRHVNAQLSKLMVALVLVGVPLAIINVLSLIAAEKLAGAPEYLNHMSPDELKAITLFCIEMYSSGITVTEIFWGLWLFPLGLLVINSRLIPKVIGVFLIIGGTAYLISSIGGMIYPGGIEKLSGYLMLPLILGEFSMILWLLIKGGRIDPATSH